jgi:hypothetical protein
MKYSKTSSRNSSAVASLMKAPLETPIPPAFRLNARSAGRFFFWAGLLGSGLDQRADEDRGEYSNADAGKRDQRRVFQMWRRKSLMAGMAFP